MCDKYAARFPVDEQYCQVKFESFGFTNKQVEKLTDMMEICKYNLLTDQAGLDGRVSKQCEQEYLSCTIWLQVRTNP